MKKVLLLLLVSVSIFSGCVSLPSSEKIRTDIQGFELPKLPESGKGIVYVVRPSSGSKADRFHVLLDDKNPDSEMGFTRGSQYIYFNVFPGKHNILSKAENWAEIPINVNRGDIIFIQQDIAFGILNVRNTLQQLKRDEGIYHVKHLRLGEIFKADK